MTPILTATVMIAAGLATRYDAGVMDRVYDNRLAWEQVTACPECAGRVALVDCAWLDDRVWLRTPGGALVGPVHVTDCGNRAHRAQQQARGLAVDLAWPLAQRLGVVDDVGRGFEVWSGPPPGCGLPAGVVVE